MPHNLLIVDYSISHVGSTHDVYAFHSTHVFKDHKALLGDSHWIWAHSAYPLEPWYIVPFKKLRNGTLSRVQKKFNYNLSTVCVHIEYAFAALKGHFQSLCELQHPMQTKKHLEHTSYWIMCCIILHNMVIRFEEECHLDTMNWATGEDGLKEEQQEDIGKDEAGDMTYKGTPGQASHSQLMDYLLKTLRRRRQE
ncbi:hypothetical protein BDR05DRAFT_874931 [Suillus weaverae]|nr:hypothetical protein BDR05DRAFT_874931 [Suillus weaverae]